MKNIGILVAMKEEMSLFAAKLQNLQKTTLHQRDFYSGIFKNIKITAVVSGMGKVNAAVCTADLISIFKSDVILNIGISGGIDNSLKIGDFVVGKSIVYHDVWCAEPNKYGQIQEMPEMYYSEPELVAKLGKYRQGLICCGDFFVEGETKMNEIKAHFPDGLAVDMESAAIAQTCYLYNVPLLSVRQISDVPGANNQIEQYKGFWARAPQQSVNLLTEILSNL